MSSLNLYIEHLEWEMFLGEVVTQLSCENGLYQFEENYKIKIYRDSQFRLRAKLYGITNDIGNLDPKMDKRAGVFFSKENAFGVSGEYHTMLNRFVIGSLESAAIDPMNFNQFSFVAEVIIDSLEQKQLTNAKIEVLNEWFLSGRIDFHLPRSTTRYRHGEKLLRIRDDIDFDLAKNRDISKGLIFSRDFLLIEMLGFKFIIAKVPEHLGPEWSYNMMIEYRESFGRIPNADEREAISELIGYVFGSQLIKIGETHFNSSSEVVSRLHVNPWGNNLVNNCLRGSLPPIKIKGAENWRAPEILIAELLSEYFINRDQLQLKDVVWRYWTAKSSAMGTNLPTLSSAIEILATRILKRDRGIKYNYMEEREFLYLLKDEMVSIEEKFRNYGDGDKIVRKIKTCFQRGANEKLDLAFGSIGLRIGKVERLAIKARNRMAHSSINSTNDDALIEVIRLSSAYGVLFNRVILKILKYEGSYIDYYTLGHPSRNIDEPIPE